MEARVLGLHHITAIAGSARRNFEFYTNVLGLRLVKKTVNFDDPGTYHFYFGDEIGSPGAILTFFPWEGITKGKTGTGVATEVNYSVPKGSLPFWKNRLQSFNVVIKEEGTRFGESFLSFDDPDGLQLTLVVSNEQDTRSGWETDDVSVTEAIKGFHSTTLTLRHAQATAAILTDIFDYTHVGNEQGRVRYKTSAVNEANIIDIIEATHQERAVNAGGTIHHIAFRVKDDTILMEFRARIVKKGFSITPKVDRNYFYSLYFREPGGVLFELATDNPGFAIDEDVSSLGTTLKLPAQYEEHRAEIEKMLPALA